MMKIILALVFALSPIASQASETVKGAKKDYEEFKIEMSKKLDETEAKISELKEKAKTRGSAAQDKTVSELEKTRDELKASLAEAKEDGKSNWKKFKSKFAKSVDKLNQKVQKSLED